MNGHNAIYTKRGQTFRPEDYPEATQKLLREKLRPIDDIIHLLPRKFGLFSTFAMSQARGFLRKLSLRDDYEEVRYISALPLEPYPIMQHPNVKITSAYLGPVERFIISKMGKTISHFPRQFTQFPDLLRRGTWLTIVAHTCAPPNEDGFLNLGVNCEIMHEVLSIAAKDPSRKIIIEINSHVPWVYGHKDLGQNLIHLSEVDYVYENHEPVATLPRFKPTNIEERIARHVAPFIQNGDTIQLGIGGVPGVIATRLKGHRDLKIHSEMLTDAVVDLDEAGAITSTGKDYMDGYIVGAFAAGTSHLYDWIDRNPNVLLLPIHAINDPEAIGRNSRMKSINSAVMVDLHGQVCSDAVGFHQISGIGGQLEFVMGAQRSPGGRSVLCLKSTRKVHRRRISAIVPTLPAGSPVAVPRQLADVIVTEYGAAEIRDLDAHERVRALIGIAHPDFRDELRKQADAHGLWEREPGFDTFVKRALFDNIPFIQSVKSKMTNDPERKAAVILNEAKALLDKPDLVNRAVGFYEKHRS